MLETKLLLMFQPVAVTYLSISGGRRKFTTLPNFLHSFTTLKPGCNKLSYTCDMALETSTGRMIVKRGLKCILRQTMLSFVCYLKLF